MFIFRISTFMPNKRSHIRFHFKFSTLKIYILIHKSFGGFLLLMYKIFSVESVITNYRWANVIVRYRTDEARCINFDWSYRVKTLDFTVNILNFTIHRMSDVSAENKAMKGNKRSSYDSTINWSSCDSTIEQSTFISLLFPLQELLLQSFE